MKKSILILTIVLVLLLSSCNIGDTVIEEEEPIYTELLSGIISTMIPGALLVL